MEKTSGNRNGMHNNEFRKRGNNKFEAAAFECGGRIEERKCAMEPSTTVRAMATEFAGNHRA